MTDEELRKIFDESATRTQRNLEELRAEMRTEREELKTRSDGYFVARTQWIEERFDRLDQKLDDLISLARGNP